MYFDFGHRFFNLPFAELKDLLPTHLRPFSQSLLVFTNTKNDVIMTSLHLIKSLLLPNTAVFNSIYINEIYCYIYITLKAAVFFNVLQFIRCNDVIMMLFLVLVNTNSD